MNKKQKIQHGPNYTIFLGLMERAEDGMSRGETFVKPITMAEIRLLNGYKINTGDDEIHIRQTYDLNSITFGTKAATYRLAAYCMGLDKRYA